MSARAVVNDWGVRDAADGGARGTPIGAHDASPSARVLGAELSVGFLHVTEQAALAAARTIGRGDRHGSDHVAVEAMRRELGALPIDGTIVIGEGERDAAPMLFIGERVGSAQSGGGPCALPELDIAVDPLEGTNLCATGEPNAIAVLAASERGGLLHAPDLYMEKLIVGPRSREVVDLDAPVSHNVRAIARSLERPVDELVVCVLDRPRHERLIQEIVAAGARVRRIGDGDLAAGIAAAVAGSGVHAVMGTGGAPEGVLTAAAMRCLGGEVLARLVVGSEEQARRCRAMGIGDPHRVYRCRDLAPGKNVLFVATGVTSGGLLAGVRRFEGGARTMSLVMHTEPRRVRFVETIHVHEASEASDLAIRF